VQPLIEPLYDGKSAHELLAALHRRPGAPGHDIVRAYWEAWHCEQGIEGEFERFWRRSLHDGFIAGGEAAPKQVTVAQAISAPSAELGRRKGIIINLILTIIFGGVFLGIKAVEYSHKIHEHLVPGPNFQLDVVGSNNVQLFFSLYFAMTGTHAFHMIIGIGLMIWLIIKARGRGFSPGYYAPVEMTGLYWHFVDIVWISLYPLLYLLGRH